MSDNGNGYRNGHNTMRGIAGRAVDGLRASPGLLAIIVLNIFFLVGMFWFLRYVETDRAATIQALIKECMERPGK